MNKDGVKSSLETLGSSPIGGCPIRKVAVDLREKKYFEFFRFSNRDNVDMSLFPQLCEDWQTPPLWGRYQYRKARLGHSELTGEIRARRGGGGGGGEWV